MNTVCPKVFTPSDVPLDPAVTLTVDSNPFVSIFLRCKRKVAATLAGLAVKNRLPVYSCQCVSSLVLALKTRMAMPLQTLTDDVVNLYHGALCRVYNWSNLWDDGDLCSRPNITDAQLISPMQFSKWVESFPKQKRTMYIQAKQDLDLGRKVIRFNREAFVKFEPYLKHADGFVNTFDPRLIVKFDPTYNALIGPYFRAFGLHLKDNLLPVVNTSNLHEIGFLSFVKPRRYSYASGLDASDLGFWFHYWTNVLDFVEDNQPLNQSQIFQRNLLKVQDEPPVTVTHRLVAIECDGSRFDGHKCTQLKEVNDAFVTRFFHKRYQHTISVAMAAVRDTKLKVKTIDACVEFSANGRQPSGHTNTSADNTQMSCAILEHGFSLLETHTPLRVFAATIALGDDTAALALVPLAALPYVQSSFVKAFADFNHKGEVLMHDKFNLRKLSFCSGYFYPVIKDNSPTSLWAPKIGRILSKLAWSKDPQVDPADFIFTVLQGYRHLFPAIPILRQYYSTMNLILTRMGAKIIVIPVEFEHKFTTKLTGFKADPQASLFFDSNFGYPLGTTIAAEHYISNLTEFQLMDHPSIDAIVDVDCPVDPKLDSGKCVSDSCLQGQYFTYWDDIRRVVTDTWANAKELMRAHWGVFEQRERVAAGIGNTFTGCSQFWQFWNFIKKGPDIYLAWFDTVFPSHGPTPFTRPANYHILKEFLMVVFSSFWEAEGLNITRVCRAISFFLFSSPFVGWWAFLFGGLLNNIAFEWPCLIGPVLEESLREIDRKIGVPVTTAYLICVETLQNANTSPQLILLLMYKTWLHGYFLRRGDLLQRIRRHLFWNLFCLFCVGPVADHFLIPEQSWFTIRNIMPCNYYC